jgi:TorA maturation chaperone TorD
MTSAQPIPFDMPDRDEESARAALYALLATLFYAPPSRELLAAIAAQPAGGDGVLQQAWTRLAAACAQADEQQVREEYETLFIGVGRSELMLYGSYYLSGFLMEKPLAALRSELAALGLERGKRMVESEDHVAALCDAMRCLIVSDTADIDVQKHFFARHLQPWVVTMCELIMQHPHAVFYPAVAAFAQTFFEVEAQAFDME